MNYNDLGALKISTKSPTVMRISQRLIVSLAPCKPKLKAYLRDMIQAYTQARTKLERQIFLEAPTEMRLQPDEVLLVEKPLYGIPESGLHWFLTFQDFHIKELGMKATKIDPCILSFKKKNKLEGATAIQVDDVFGIGSDDFLKIEEETATKFKSKKRKILSPGQQATFNGTTISFEKDNTYKLLQKEKLEALSPVTTNKNFHSARAKIQYVGVMTRPDLCAETQLLANGIDDPSKEDLKRLNKLIKYCKKTKDIGLKFVKLDLDSTKIVLFTDSSFANAKNLKSQLGFVIALVDKENNANIIHFGSSRCQRVTRSAMASCITLWI